MPIRYTLIAILLVGLVGYAFGRYVQPAKVVTQIKEVTKTVEVVKHDTTTVTHEHKNKDGSTDTDTQVIDHDIDLTHSDTSKQITQVTSSEKPQWKALVLTGYNYSTYQPEYGGGIEHRFIGPIFLGVWGNNHQTGGVAISLEF